MKGKRVPNPKTKDVLAQVTKCGTRSVNGEVYGEILFPFKRKKLNKIKDGSLNLMMTIIKVSLIKYKIIKQ